MDEKSQIQALERTQPLRPLGLGYVEGVTHDYIRRGTTTLFAALDVASGQVITQCKPKHRHQEFLQFHHIEKSTPPDSRFTWCSITALHTRTRPRAPVARRT